MLPKKNKNANAGKASPQNPDIAFPNADIVSMVNIGTKQMSIRSGVVLVLLKMLVNLRISKVAIIAITIPTMNSPILVTVPTLSV